MVSSNSWRLHHAAASGSLLNHGTPFRVLTTISRLGHRARSRILGLAGNAGGSLLQPTMRAEHEHRIAKNRRETLFKWKHGHILEQLYPAQLLSLNPLFWPPFPIRTPSVCTPGCSSPGNLVIPFATSMTRVPSVAIMSSKPNVASLITHISNRQRQLALSDSAASQAQQSNKQPDRTDPYSGSCSHDEVKICN